MMSGPNPSTRWQKTLWAIYGAVWGYGGVYVMDRWPRLARVMAVLAPVMLGVTALTLGIVLWKMVV